MNHVEAEQVRPFEWAVGIVRAQLHRGVNILGAGNPFLQRVGRLVDDHRQDAWHHPTGAVSYLHCLFADGLEEGATELKHCLIALQREQQFDAVDRIKGLHRREAEYLRGAGEHRCRIGRAAGYASGQQRHSIGQPLQVVQHPLLLLAPAIRPVVEQVEDIVGDLSGGFVQFARFAQQGESLHQRANCFGVRGDRRTVEGDFIVGGNAGSNNIARQGARGHIG